MNFRNKFKIRFSKESTKQYKNIIKKNNVDLKKINDILESIENNPETGIAHPERLKGQGERIIYSRKINKKDRIIYEVISDYEVVITSLIGHYDDK